MLQRNELIACAMDFASYLVSKVENINRIILHGSVARGNFDSDSDIDLFIDVLDRKSEKKIRDAENGYYKTKSYNEWKLKGVKNEFSLIIGKLDGNEWKELKRAILSTGITLYGKYTAESSEAKHYVLFSFENVRPEGKRVALFRKLFGFKSGKKTYSGLSEKFNIKRLGKGILLVPIEHAQELKHYFQNNKIAVRLYDVWSDNF